MACVMCEGLCSNPKQLWKLEMKLAPCGNIEEDNGEISKVTLKLSEGTD